MPQIPTEPTLDRRSQILEIALNVFAQKGFNGATTKEIATVLGLSVKTVNNHRARILQKLGTKTTAELIRYALRNKLIE